MTTSTRSEQISAFYTANAQRLREIVWRRAGVPAHVIDDACQSAWTTLVRRPDVTLDKRGFSWLLVSAVHEAWRLASIARELPAGDFHGPAYESVEEHSEPVARDERSAEDQAIDRIKNAERLALLATLKPAEREALFLKGLGYSYDEIAARMQCTYTAVNRRITEGRGRLRKAANTRDGSAA